MERKQSLKVAKRSINLPLLVILPTFWEAFGLATVPALLIALICISWIVWLIVLTLAPNEAANFLMDTRDFDDGRFWMLLDLDTEMKVVVVGALAAVALAYLHILIKMLRYCPNEQLPGAWARSLERRLDRWIEAAPPVFLLTNAARATKRSIAFWRELTGFRGRYRKFWNLWLKVVDLVMQSLLLHQLMRDGAALVVTIGYTAFLVIHSAVFAVILAARRHSAFDAILIDSAFDLVVTIAIPILTLLHAYMTCDIDYESFRIYNQFFPEGSFERRARMMADPSEVARFRSSFDALRVQTVTDLLLRVGMHFFSSYRFDRLLGELVRQRVKLERPSSMEAMANQRHVPRAASLVFVAFGVIVPAVVSAGITGSLKACAPYPQCVTHVYWSDSSGYCPCLMLIDVDPAPRSFDEWMNPPDVTETVRALAAPGTLRLLHLVNRDLRRLPEELRACERLELVYVATFCVCIQWLLTRTLLPCRSLLYTGTDSIPWWLKTFRRLEYLHIDGRFGGPTLRELPSDLFSSFPSLMFLQIGVHVHLKQFPALSGLPSLRSLFLARLFSMTELPSLSNMPVLERLDFTFLPFLQTLPDLAPVADSLIHFALYRTSYVCCNGFLGACDLTHPFCTGGSGTDISIAPCAVCETQRATPATLLTLQRFNDSVCEPSTIDLASDFPNQERMDVCGGVLYRECRIGDQKGICYNSRLQGIGCTMDVNKIKIRRRQIARGAGEPCNVKEEAWLGCDLRLFT